MGCVVGLLVVHGLSMDCYMLKDTCAGALIPP